MLPLTRDATRCIELANHEAKRLGAGRIEPEHVLLGLCANDPSLAPSLRRLIDDVPLRSLRLHVEKLTRGRAPALVRDVLPPSPATRRLLVDAAGVAGLVGQPELAPEHLLLALVRHDDSISARILARVGLNVAAVRKLLADAVERWCTPPAPIAVIPPDDSAGVLPYEPHLPPPRRWSLGETTPQRIAAVFAFMGVVGLIGMALLVFLAT